MCEYFTDELHFRGMAISLLLMFGRIGAVAGINFTAALIYDYCNWFYIVNFGCLLTSTYICFVILKQNTGKVRPSNRNAAV